MELTIDTREVEQILLDWAEQKFPGAFNAVRLRATYGSLDRVEFSKETPEPPESVAVCDERR